MPIYYQSGTFFRQLTLSETIDQAKIDAKRTDGRSTKHVVGMQ